MNLLICFAPRFEPLPADFLRTRQPEPDVQTVVSTILLFVLSDTVDLGRRASAVKRRLQIAIDDHFGQFRTDHARPEGDDLRVIAAARTLRRKGIVTLRGPDSRHLVRGDSHADPGTAEQDAALELLCHDRFGDLEPDIRLQHGLATKGATVTHLVALGQKMRLDDVAESAGSFVTTNRNFHDPHTLTK